MSNKVKILYQNWEGKVSWRVIIPNSDGLHFGCNQWHPDDQWLLNAFDVDKKEDRTFALKDIIKWEPYNQ